MSYLFNLLLCFGLGFLLLRGLFYALFFGAVWAVIIFDKACDLAVWPLEKLFGDKGN